MIIYRDLITGEELFSDSYPMSEVMDGMMYRLVGKLQTENRSVDADIGANPSAEGDEDDGGAADSDSQTGINIVMAHRLAEMPYDKKSFQKGLKEWCGKVLKKLQETNPDRAAIFKEKMPNCVKELLKEFDDYQFFVGESMETEGCTVLVKWEDSEPILYAFKDGVIEEKY